jgi:hypothetical protein
MPEIASSETEKKSEVSEFKMQDVEDKKFLSNETREIDAKDLEKLKQCPEVSDKFCKTENGRAMVCENGVKNIDWEKHSKYADYEGFDTRKATHDATVEKGAIIDRYGDSGGRFASPEGEPYEKRGLPYEKGTAEYHRYEVLEPVKCRYGEAAPNFNSEGGAKQMAFNENLESLMEQKKVQEV